MYLNIQNIKVTYLKNFIMMVKDKLGLGICLEATTSYLYYIIATEIISMD